MRMAVVTGAGRGVGRLTALALTGKGYGVVATDIDGDSARATAELASGFCEGVQQDVRDPESHRRVAALAASHGTLALWINNAAVLDASLAFEQDDDMVRRLVETNLLGVIWGSHAAVHTMSAGKPPSESLGHIINICSIASVLPTPGVGIYGATKRAVLGYSLSLQGDLETAGMGIRVSAFCPDTIDTRMVRDLLEREHSSILYNPRRLIPPEDVANRIVRLAERPELVCGFPRRRISLARYADRFPRLGLRILRRMRKRGERHRQKLLGR